MPPMWGRPIHLLKPGSGQAERLTRMLTSGTEEEGDTPAMVKIKKLHSTTGYEWWLIMPGFDVYLPGLLRAIKRLITLRR